MATRVI